MPGGYRKIDYSHQSLTGMAVILALLICGGLPGSAAATPNNSILQLNPYTDHYFLGPHLAYLEDPQKNLTIQDVTSPQMSTRFNRHAAKMLNLGLNSSAYWIRFSIDASEDQILQRKWLLYFDWPNRIDYATLYIPHHPYEE